MEADGVGEERVAGLEVPSSISTSASELLVLSLDLDSRISAQWCFDLGDLCAFGGTYPGAKVGSMDKGRIR